MKDLEDIEVEECFVFYNLSEKHLLPFVKYVSTLEFIDSTSICNTFMQETGVPRKWS